LGAVGEWLYEVVGGIRLDASRRPGERIVIRPQPGGGLTEAAARYESIYGEIRCEWHHNPDSLSMRATIPANGEATIFVPARKPQRITADGKPVEIVHSLDLVERTDTSAVLRAGSGTYTFEVR
ncbi:MAG: alpha-L-rhamnosidase, partial [Actinobacteria bacterium]|nr:alpha-L-rhamnosidase [Actinomycetota bacterium]